MPQEIINLKLALGVKVMARKQQGRSVEFVLVKGVALYCNRRANVLNVKEQGQKLVKEIIMNKTLVHFVVGLAGHIFGDNKMA